MNAAVLITVILANLGWAWIAPYITPRPAPIAVVVVGTEAPHVERDVASNGH